MPGRPEIFQLFLAVSFRHGFLYGRDVTGIWNCRRKRETDTICGRNLLLGNIACIPLRFRAAPVT